MSVFIDRKHLLMASSRLRNFKQKRDDLYNCSCPFCGDSQTNHLKARGYISRSKHFNGYIFTCHHCNISVNMGTLLKHLDPAKHKEYIMERFAEANTAQPQSVTAQPVIETPKPMVMLTDIKLPSINDLPPEHYARAYIEARRIPTEHWGEIFFTEGYREFLDDLWPDHGKPLAAGEPRLVLFYTNPRGGITNVSGRSFGADAKLRYITVKVSEERKVFGLHRMNPKKPVYITEGQFDSLFLQNAVASGDSNLTGLADWLYDTFGVKPILVYDNEPRNREIVKGIAKAVRAGWPTVIWPDVLGAKDINDMVMADISIETIKAILSENTYTGLTAELMLQRWRKC
jgi:hypothetical protein